MSSAENEQGLRPDEENIFEALTFFHGHGDGGMFQIAPRSARTGKIGHELARSFRQDDQIEEAAAYRACAWGR